MPQVDKKTGSILYCKGEILCREGEVIQSLRVLQSGLVALVELREKKTIEIAHVRAPQVLGEEALNGIPRFGYQAVALNDTYVVEIPLASAKKACEPLGQVPKAIFKGLLEKVKYLQYEVRDARLESDAAPCPPSAVAKVFGVIYHVAQYTGTSLEGKVVVSYPAFKKYAQRIFLESPIRIEQALFILVKLGHAEIQMIKDEVHPEEADEIGYLIFSNLKAVEDFFDYYQNVFFKGSSSQLLRVDDKIVRITAALVDATADAVVDRRGIVSIPFTETMDRLKKILGNTFTADQLYRIEQKGLFLKRETDNKGATLSFFRAEYLQMLENWRFIKEIEKWNEAGIVEVSALPEGRILAPNQKKYPLKNPVSQLAASPARSDQRLEKHASQVNDPVSAPVIKEPAKSPRAKKLATDWTPEVVKRSHDPGYLSQFPILRSGGARPGEMLCTVCMSPVQKDQPKCGVCDTTLKKAS